ncbi:MAG: hypothetical protein DRJ49_02240 [Thermoprotei archaeon]|nr:MAG: hypothetical protein DRJ49_02240 [Thermoprotei archaeon]
MVYIVKLDVISLGEAIIDLIPIDHFTYKACFGGAPMNTAIACAKLGMRVGVLTAIGRDALGEIIVRTLNQYGIDTSRVRRLPYRTTLAFVVKLPEGEREFFFYRKPWSLSADTELRLEESDYEYVCSSKILHLTGFSLSQEPARSSILTLLENISGKLMVSLDPTIRLDVWKSIDDLRKTMKRAIEYIDILLATRSELELLLEVRGLEKVIESLRSMEFKVAGIKMGRLGAILIEDEKAIYMKSFKVEVKDTVGAGDAWNAAVLFGISKGDKIEDILCLANAVAAIKCMHVGAISGLPTYEEVLKFISVKGIPEYRYL